jgi:hypothetical protein
MRQPVDTIPRARPGAPSRPGFFVRTRLVGSRRRRHAVATSRRYGPTNLETLPRLQTRRRPALVRRPAACSSPADFDDAPATRVVNRLAQSTFSGSCACLQLASQHRAGAAGAAHTPSPDVRSGHPALRSLHAGYAPPAWLRLPPSPAPGAWAAPHPRKTARMLRGRMPSAAPETGGFQEKIAGRDVFREVSCRAQHQRAEARQDAS